MLTSRYPIRDPFFKMLPRTLSNFMNAFTASDHTFYPFATTNAQDFKNLLSVYMDATLHPLLKATDFTQEGWRVGPENPQAAAEDASKLVFKGVVYNEMKGQMSDAGYLFYIRFQDHIFPAIHNSGGDPQKITDLTYAQLRQFHAEHYHPSNAKVFTYGDMPLADHLREIDVRLSAFDRSARDAEIRRPIDLAAGRQEVVLQGPMDPLVDAGRQFKTSVSWILGDTADVVESFALALVSTLLIDGYGSPLYKGLIETGLGIDWSPNTGYDSSAPVGIFSVGLTGVQEADVPRVRDEVQAILRSVRDKGFERAKIDGYLHQLELSLKHKTANFGVSLLQRLKPKWFTGVDPFDALAWNDTIAAFEARLAQGGYLEGLLDTYLLDRHTLTFTMAPSATFGQELAQEEDARLAAKIAAVAAEAGSEAAAREKLAEEEAVLLVEQAKSNTEDLSCLPSVHVRDIPRTKAPVAVREETLAGDNAAGSAVKVQWREAPTNGLTYFRAINALGSGGVPDGLRPLIPLFTDAIMRLGTRTHSMEQLEDRIKLLTGGVSVGYHSAALPTDHTAASEGFVFTGLALDRNVPAMLALLRTLVLETDFDSPAAVQQVRQLLQAASDGVVNDIASSGHSYARRRAEAGLTRGAFLREEVSGLSQVKLMTGLAGRPETDQLDDVLAKLKAIQQLALQADASGGGGMRAAITCGAESVGANTAALSRFMGTLTTGGTASVASTEAARRVQQAFGARQTFFPLPYQVYYGALVLPTVPYTSPDGAPLQILGQLLTHKHLHHEIREKGGAYGAGAFAQALEGVFGLYTYRDPNPVNSLAVMRGAGQWAVDRATTALTERDLEEAKISVFQSVDAPRAVNEEGMGQFLYGVTEAMRQARREQLLDVTRAQVQDVAQRYVVDGLARQAERTVFLGGGSEAAAWVDRAAWTVEEMNVQGA